MKLNLEVLFVNLLKRCRATGISSRGTSEEIKVMDRRKNGTLYIGLNDGGYVVGIENSKRMLEALPNKICDKLGVITSINIYKANGAENVRYGNHIP